MKIRVLFLMLLSLLPFIVGGSSNGHQVPSSEDLAHGHAMPRKLMFDQKVESVKDKDSMSYNEALSGESHRGALKESRVFTMDYSPVKKRRPVHNKFSPAAITTP